MLVMVMMLVVVRKEGDNGINDHDDDAYDDGDSFGPVDFIAGGTRYVPEYTHLAPTKTNSRRGLFPPLSLRLRYFFCIFGTRVRYAAP